MPKLKLAVIITSTEETIAALKLALNILARQRSKVNFGGMFYDNEKEKFA